MDNLAQHWLARLRDLQQYCQPQGSTEWNSELGSDWALEYHDVQSESLRTLGVILLYLTDRLCVIFFLAADIGCEVCTEKSLRA